MAVREAPAVEISHVQMRSIHTNALVWTQGLADWLPIGDLPREIPPQPLAIQMNL